MSVNNNADDWANARIGIYFPATAGGSLADGAFTGQCASLTKWFLNEMTAVPSPGASRGNAKDIGATLVAQGHAIEVGAAQRRRGDLVIWKQDGGGHGHIGVLLSGDRVFEQNVGIAGAASRVVVVRNAQGVITERITVYSSRIDPLVQSWRKGSPTYYRINSYAEKTTAPTTNNSGSDKEMTEAFIRRTYYMVAGRNPEQTEVNFHMAKSNPESFINGFGDTPLWLTLTRERDALVGERNQAIAERNEAREALAAAGNSLIEADKSVVSLREILAHKEGDVIKLEAQIAAKDEEIKTLTEQANTATPPSPSGDNAIVRFFAAIVAALTGKK